MSWAPEQVAALAPDGAGLSAAQRLARAGAWSSEGASSDRAVWGAVAGSGKTPYDIAVDLSGPAYRCSCPSRKVPCKHALGLLLRWAAGVVPVGEEPGADVAAWLAARDARGGGAPTPGAAPDQEAKAKRVAARAERISGGVADLDRFLEDLVRGGLAAAQARPYSAWDQAAARLVDAQAPGLASRVRGLGAYAHSGPGWPGRLLDGAGRVHLAVRAWQQGEALDEATRADVRSYVGWPVDQDAVRAGEPVSDRWLVAGVRVEEDERLRSRRTWLAGADTGRLALLLAFAAAGQAFEGEYVPGSALEGDLAFFPGSVPLRALRVGDAGVVQDGLAGGMPGATSVAGALQAWAEVLAANPWHGRFAFALAAVVPVRTGDGWVLRDPSGDALRLDDEHAWELAALAGGRPLPVFGEWYGGELHALLALGADGPVAFA